MKIQEEKEEEEEEEASIYLSIQGVKDLRRPSKGLRGLFSPEPSE